MAEQLDVYLYGVNVAALELLGPQQYRLAYRTEWLDDPNRMPVSASLPLTPKPATGVVLAAYLDNLLPDNADVRDRWAVDAGLATPEPFHLLRVYGADVAGAIQFAEPGTDPNANGERTPVNDKGIASRIRAIREDDTSWQDPERDTGYFSLGGAQGKFSLGNTGDGWYEPTGNHPTTHILKPRVRQQVDGELIEYIAMTAATVAGINTAPVTIQEFDGERALVVDRFDRIVNDDGTIIRVHQEDMAQALGVPRLRKYESKGGPGYRDIIRLLDTYVPEERRAVSMLTFTQALVFSWMVLNTDAHAKNYSVFIRPDGLDLTPLYDVSSLIPYAGHIDDDRRATGIAFRKSKLSMRIAADYEAGEQSWFEWLAVARETGLDRAALSRWGGLLAERLPELINAIAGTLPGHLQTDVVARFVDRTEIRSRQVSQAIAK